MVMFDARVPRAAMFWRVAVPVAAVALFIAMLWVSKQNHECSAYCELEGFHGARYTPQGRGSSRAQCHCLTKEESEIKRRVPKGTEVYPWGQ